MQPHKSGQAQQHWHVSFIQFEILVDKKEPFSVFFSALISSASEEGLRFFLNFNPLNTKRRLLYLKTQLVPRSKHFSSRL